MLVIRGFAVPNPSNAEHQQTHLAFDLPTLHYLAHKTEYLELKNEIYLD